MTRTYLDTTQWTAPNTPSIDSAKIEIFIEKMKIAQGDSDKASECLDSEYWQGCADAYKDALNILFDKESTDNEEQL